MPDPATKERLAALARGKAVTFLHGLDDDALVREYRRAMCIVLPSVYRTDEGYETLVPELLGQTLLEGMACGTPAICTDVASMPEIVEHGVTGFVVPPNDPAGLGERLSWLRAQSDGGLDHGSRRSSARARSLHVGRRRQPLSRRVQRDAVARARERSRVAVAGSAR